MAEFPYTDEQVRQFAVCDPDGEMVEVPGYTRQLLETLHDAGITLTFPEPRYWAAFNKIEQRWEVIDEMEACAIFHGPYAEQYAREHADRLNVVPA